MSACVLVISSNFPIWKEIIERNQYGLCVHPLNPKAIAEVIDHLITHCEEAENGA